MSYESAIFSGSPESSSRLYDLIRAADDERFRKAKEHCEELWRSFEPFADKHFLSEFPLHFHERWFEMYLTVSLLRLGLDIQCPKPGPDILLTSGSRRIWIEAVCATSGQKGFPDSVPELVPGKLMDVPKDPYVLRIRNSLDQKARIFSNYIKNRIVGQDDITVVAISVWSAGLWPQDMLACMPRSLYGIGDPILEYDKVTGEQVGSRYEMMTEIRKRSSGSPVVVQPFTDGSVPHISAVLASWANVVSLPKRLGDDCILYPNLSCANPWLKGTVPMGEEWSYKEAESGWCGTLTTHIV